MEFIVKILETKQVTHDVKRFRVEKPSGYSFHPGQATELSVNRPGWTEEKRPFTFTCLPEDPYLEFTIKRYPERHGVTDLLHQLRPGEEVILRDVWGAIEYKGPGCFIAGGAGITPFLAIFRQLDHQKAVAGNTLFFSNKTAADVIEEDQLRSILGPNAFFILSQEKKEGNLQEKEEGNLQEKEEGNLQEKKVAHLREKKDGYLHGRIDEDFLRHYIRDFHQPFYICGPDPMIHEISGLLTGMGASPETLVFEK
jgi:glycine betaine catabolism B